MVVNNQYKVDNMPLVKGGKDSSEKGDNTSSGRPKNPAIAIAFEACRIPRVKFTKERERKSKAQGNAKG